MKDKNKEAIKILEENPLTNVYSPEDQIKMELMKAKDKRNMMSVIGTLQKTLLKELV